MYVIIIINVNLCYSSYSVFVSGFSNTSISGNKVTELLWDFGVSENLFLYFKYIYCISLEYMSTPKGAISHAQNDTVNLWDKFFNSKLLMGAFWAKE